MSDRMFKLPADEYRRLSLDWSPKGWWTELGFPDFPRRAFVLHGGDYVRWRMAKRRARVALELTRDWRPKKGKNPDKKNYRPKKRKNERRLERSLERLVGKHGGDVRAAGGPGQGPAQGTGA